MIINKFKISLAVVNKVVQIALKKTCMEEE